MKDELFFVLWGEDKKSKAVLQICILRFFSYFNKQIMFAQNILIKEG